MNDLSKCHICLKPFLSIRLLGCHIAKIHNISTEEYYNHDRKNSGGKCGFCGNSTRFINLRLGYTRCCSIKCSKLLDNQSPEYREKISRETKKAMWTPEVRTKHLEAVKLPKSLVTRERMSVAAKKKFEKDPTLRFRLYTEKRNHKIAKKKTDYWKLHPEEKGKVGLLWKAWKERDEKGWREHLRRASKKGFEKIFAPNGDTSLEIILYNMLQSEGLKFSKKYEVEGKIYDAFLPEKNTLIEIDGDFWHRKSLDDCKYEFQRESFHNDRKKEEIAKRNNMRLIRIKEHHIPTTIGEIL